MKLQAYVATVMYTQATYCNMIMYDYNTNMIVRSQPHAGRDTVRPRGILNQNNFRNFNIIIYNVPVYALV